MTPAVPDTAERLLEGLGADAEYRDALLGDLAEEYALRVAPHLVRDGLRRLDRQGVRRLATVVVISYLVAHFAHLALARTMLHAVRLVAGHHVYPLTHVWALQLSWAEPLRGAVVLALLLAFTALAPVLSGFVAASTEDDAPFFPALALGATQLGLLLVQMAAGLQGPVGPAWVPGPTVPTWVVVCQCALVVAGPAAGAALRVRARRRPAAE